MRVPSPLDGLVTRHIKLDKLIKEVETHLREESKEEAEEAYKKFVKLYYDLKLRDQLDITANYYYYDLLCIYEEKLRRHRYKKKQGPLTLSDRVDNLV